MQQNLNHIQAGISFTIQVNSWSSVVPILVFPFQSDLGVSSLDPSLEQLAGGTMITIVGTLPFNNSEISIVLNDKFAKKKILHFTRLVIYIYWWYNKTQHVPCFISIFFCDFALIIYLPFAVESAPSSWRLWCQERRNRETSLWRWDWQTTRRNFLSPTFYMKMAGVFFSLVI